MFCWWCHQHHNMGHYGAITSMRFPHYWHLVREIHRSSVDSLHKEPLRLSFDNFLLVWLVTRDVMARILRHCNVSMVCTLLMVIKLRGIIVEGDLANTGGIIRGFRGRKWYRLWFLWWYGRGMTAWPFNSAHTLWVAGNRLPGIRHSRQKAPPETPGAGWRHILFEWNLEIGKTMNW